MQIRRTLGGLLTAVAVPALAVLGAGLASAEPVQPQVPSQTALVVPAVPTPITPGTAAIGLGLPLHAVGCIVGNDQGGCAGSGVYDQVVEGGTAGAATGAAGGCAGGALAGGVGCAPGAAAGALTGLVGGSVGNVVRGLF